MRKFGRVTPLAAAVIFVSVTATSLTPAAMGAMPSPAGPPVEVVILHCIYYSAGVSGVFRTEVKGIEVSGRGDVGLETGIPCSQAISRLSSLGFATVASTSAAADFNGDGVVDAADYVVWRKTP